MTARGDQSKRQGRCGHSRSRLALLIAAAFFVTVLGSAVPCAEAWGAPAPPPTPSESECRPYIEKALKQIEGTEANCDEGGCDTSKETEISTEDDGGGDNADSKEGESSTEAEGAEGAVGESKDETESKETAEETSKEDETKEVTEEVTAESQEATESTPQDDAESQETKEDGDEKESHDENKEESVEAAAESVEEAAGSQDSTTDSTEEPAAGSQEEAAAESAEEPAAGSQEAAAEESVEEPAAQSQEAAAEESVEEPAAESQEAAAEESVEESAAGSQEEIKEESAEETAAVSQEETSAENQEATAAESAEEVAAGSEEVAPVGSQEEAAAESAEEVIAESADEVAAESPEEAAAESKEDTKEESSEDAAAEGGDAKEESVEANIETSKEESTEAAAAAAESKEDTKEEESTAESQEEAKASDEETKEDADKAKSEENPEEDLTMEIEVPENLRPREHIAQILKLDPESAETEMLLQKTVDVTLRELKRLYDSAIKPLEILYKYRDLSNRHFGDPEIFSKPLILFMGPWSGGKSSIINYLLGTEFTPQSLRTGAEPSPAYFNILMHGERYEVLDGTQLAADWTFSGLQKFGQGLLDRLRGVRLNSPLLEKVNIVEIPGILEIRKQVERLFPFNDACQWFIDRADIIFLVYDPSKLDVGPETEAILDQLKGREYQTRIILNKADQVKPEELMRVQGTLIWNISPLMSSAEPPVMYSTSLWSMPYENGAPLRLLSAQERAFLRDLRTAFDKRVENKIASARRFAVRVRNHAKMVDCYLTTYYNHKSFFGNKKKVSDDIIEHPQDYHIYEGLSTLSNISRYDLPDPDSYRDFFRLNPLFEFQQLAATCTYFRGCPINRLDVAIAYDLPELVGKYKNTVEDTLASVSNSNGPPKS